MIPGMNESEFHNHHFYENYILGRLTQEQENLFEEHLLMCNYCQKELEIVEKAILDIKRINPNQQQSTKTKRVTPKLFLGIAASILIIISAGIYFLTKNSHEQIKQTPIVKEYDTIHDDTVTKDYILAEEQPSPTKPKEYINPDNYKLLPEFENAIQNSTRSSTIEVISPKNSDYFLPADTILFDWKSNAGNLSLVLFSNTGDVIFEQVVRPPFKFPETFKSGLYYWQLEDTNESYHTGKFSIK